MREPSGRGAPDRTPFWRGVESGAFALAVAALLRWLFAAPFLPELMALRLFEMVPMGVFEFFIRLLGAWAKWTAFAGTILITLAFSGLAGRLLAPLRNQAKPLLSWAAIAVLLAASASLVGLPLLGVDPLGREMFPPPRIPALAGITAVCAAYAAWFVWGAERRKRR